MAFFISSSAVASYSASSSSSSPSFSSFSSSSFELENDSTLCHLGFEPTNLIKITTEAQVRGIYRTMDTLSVAILLKNISFLLQLLTAYRFQGGAGTHEPLLFKFLYYEVKI